MSLHGEIMVNAHVIGEWSAQNAGPNITDGIYRCHVTYTDMRGYLHERRFFMFHNYDDGALVLSAQLMLEFNRRKGDTVHSEVVEWATFCELYGYDMFSDLGKHIKLRETTDED